MKSLIAMLASIAVTALLAAQTACSRPDDGGETHTHADGTTHDGPAEDEHTDIEDALGLDDTPEHGHGHDEVDLGTVTIDGMEVQLAQGHGAVGAGLEGHLVVKLPYTDSGATIVRAWIGTADRTLSMVGLGEYAPSHDDYDIHAMAPDPLPESAMWWIEIETPDGAKVVGSAKPM